MALLRRSLTGWIPSSLFVLVPQGAPDVEADGPWDPKLAVVESKDTVTLLSDGLPNTLHIQAVGKSGEYPLIETQEGDKLEVRPWEA